MQCNRCGAMLPTGAPSCPNCANPTPYNVGSSPSNVYAPPPPTNYGPPPYAPPPGAYGPPVMVPVMVQQRKKSGCGTAAIIVLVVLLVVVCGGAFLATNVISRQNATATVTSMTDDATATADDATYTAALTPTPYPPYTESQSPSGADFSEAAQQVIPNAQLASAVDSSSHRPTELQSTFQSGQTIYLVYKWAQGNTGYVQTRWFYNGESKGEVMSKYIGQYAAGYGYMTGNFYAYGNTGQGTIEVFWCQDSGCNHGGLAWVRPFSVAAG